MKKPHRRLTLLALALLTAGCGWALLRRGSAGEVTPSLEIMAGQMLMIGFQGTRPDQPGPQALAQQIREGKVGGVITLGMNFNTRKGITGLTRLFRKAAGAQPILLAVDQEGGLVQRLGPKLGYEAMPSATQTAKTMSPEQARSVFDRMTTMVNEAGFNVNLAPVVDLGVNLQNTAVGNNFRTYDRRVDRVVQYARMFVRALQAQHILPVLKHFPGHGSSPRDSHEDFVDISDTWNAEELEPFRQLIDTPEPVGIMTGHLVLRSLGPEGCPVSLSTTAIEGNLRRRMNFDGLVISDDLQMAAIRKHYGLEEAVVLAINAGVDVLMITNSGAQEADLPGKVVKDIVKAVNEGRIRKDTLVAAWRRIMKVKKWLAQ